MANISNEHPHYLEQLPRWTRCRDAAAGQDVVKSKGAQYLPVPPGIDSETYTQHYLRRASFFNATARTVEGLSGALFQKSPELGVPTFAEPWLEDVTQTREPFSSFALTACREVLTTGRFGVMVDMPAEGGQRPYLIGRQAEDIVSWDTERKPEGETLTRVVLKESTLLPESEVKADGDPYKMVPVVTFRELFLDEKGRYAIRVWQPISQSHLVPGAGTSYAPSEPIVPMRRGAALPFIPFVFLNSRNLSPTPERPPLLDLVDVNYSHYLTSADFEWSLFQTSCPVLWIAGMKANAGEPVKFGPSVALVLPENGKAGFAEVSGNGIGSINDALDRKQKLMAVLGARLLEEQPKSAETASAVQLRNAGTAATLLTIANTLDQGLTLALKYAAWWGGAVGAPDAVKAEVVLNKELAVTRVDAPTLRAWTDLWMAEGISHETLYMALAKAGATRPGVSAEDERGQIKDEAEDVRPSTMPGGREAA